MICIRAAHARRAVAAAGCPSVTFMYSIHMIKIYPQTFSPFGSPTTVRGHMMPPPLHVYNELARPADECVLTRDIATTGQTTGHGENIIACEVHSALCSTIGIHYF